MSFGLHFTPDPAAFLDEAHDHLAAEPVLNTVVAATAHREAADQRAGIALDPANWYVVVRDAGGAVVGAGMRTAPFTPRPLYLLPMPTDAAVALARTLSERGEEVGGVNGALEPARACAEELARLTGRTVRVGQHARLFSLTTVVDPAPVPGRLRLATSDDADLVRGWLNAFRHDADVQAGRPPGSGDDGHDAAQVLRRITAGRVSLWVDPAGEPVNLTGHQDPSFGVQRIAPVYTPPEHRGHGYASAAVAEVSRRILAAGARPCLFTDQANPTSNKIYRAVGFEPVVDMINLTL